MSLRLLKNKKGGVALILVIWIIVMLMAIVGEFTYSMRTELNITKNFKEEEEAYQLALAGIEHAKIEILTAEGPTYLKDGILILNQTDEEPVRKGSLGKGSFIYTITDEDGKLNINLASVAQLKHLLRGSGVDVTEVDTIVDSIIDWRDRNELHMLNGAEEEYYRSLPEPYSCKDAPFDIIEELLLVKGMTEEVFYGSEKEESKYKGIMKYLTVMGSGAVNINTTSRVVLEALFGTEMADNIIAQREAGPITKPMAKGKINSTFFTIISTGFNADGSIKRTIKTIVQKRGKEVKILYWNDNFLG
jgi:general secretion pathway protein K